MLLSDQKKNSLISSLIPFRSAGTFTQVIEYSGIKKEAIDSGAAWSDFDGDGYLDLILSDDNSNRVLLYHNNGDETFTDVTYRAGLTGLVAASAEAFGDYDNDGCPDLYLSYSGSVSNQLGIADRLFHNNCNGTFSDVTAQAGIADKSHSFGVSWVDYDHDGKLDLYIATFGYSKSRFDSIFEPNLLYHNNGNGTFTNVTEKAHLSGLPVCQITKSFQDYRKEDPRNYNVIPAETRKLDWQPIWFDYDNDGWPDVYIGNDAGVGGLFRNNHDGTFTDSTEQAGLCQTGSGMGVTVGDYDNDGWLDLYVTHTGRNLLWHNNQNGTFSEVSEDLGVENFNSLGWGTGFFDYDNDGNLDLYAVNGYTHSLNLPTSLANRITNGLDHLFRGSGGGKFEEVSKKEGVFGSDPKSAAIFGDYNNDGFIDIFVNSVSGFPNQSYNLNRLYRNKPNGNHWLTVQLIGTKSNRDAVGARITTHSQGKSQIREIAAGTSFLGENSLWQTFGLGHSESVDELEISWPSGIKQVLTKLKVDRKIVVRERD